MAYTSPSIFTSHSERPYPAPALLQWREELLIFTARITFFLVLPTWLLTLVSGLALQHPWWLLYDLLSVGILGVVAFAPHLSFRLRAVLLLGVAYYAGTLWLFISGLPGTGRLYLIVPVVLSALLLGRRSTLLIWLLTLCTSGLIYAAFGYDLVPLPSSILERLFSPGTLAVSWLAQLLVSGAMGGAVLLTVQRLQHSLQQEHRAQVALQRLNIELEEHVQARTAELHSSQARLQAIFDNVAVGMGMVDGQGQILHVNQRVADMLGYPPEELTRQTVWDVTYSEDIPIDQAHLQELIQGNIPGYCLEKRFIRKDGSFFWGDLAVTAIHNDEQEDTDVVSIVTDITTRKQAEEALRASEAQFRSIFNDAPLAIGYADQDGTILNANPAYLNLFGYSLAELRQMSFADFTYPDDLTIDWAQFEQMIAGAIDHYSLEKRFVQKSGQVVWAQMAVSLVRDAKGNPAFVIGMIEDITERKQAELILRESEARFHHLLQANPLIIFSSRASGDFGATFVSANIRNVLGYEPHEFTDRSDFWASHIHPDDAPAVFANLPDLFEHNEHQHEYRFLHRNGTYRWMRNVMRLIYDDDGTPLEIIGILEDITERKQAEETLHQYRRIVSATPDAMSLLDCNYTYQIVNDAYLHRTLKPYDEIVGHSVVDLMGREPFEDVIKSNLDRCLNGETIHYQEWFSAIRDGERFMDVTYTPYRDDQGNIAGALVSSRDITDVKRAEEEIRELNCNLAQRNEELESLNRELEAFGYAIAHHLRSPLWTVRLSAEAVREDNADRLDEDSKNLLLTIDTTIERINQTIERLLTMASLTREQVTCEPVNLSALVQEIADELHHNEPARQVVFEIAPEMITVGDARLLRMLLENLLENAWKYTCRCTTARISFATQTHPQTGMLVYLVRDNGAGFDQTHAGKAFRAFHRLHATSEFPGTGIGLAMVRRIVHLHGGSIWAEAERGKGATFFFTLG